MKTLYFCLFFVLVMNLGRFDCYMYRQERAVVKEYDPRYVSNPQALTGRAARGKPYLTNLTATTLHVWNNNVTLKIVYRVAGSGTDFPWKIKLCDILNTKWLLEYFRNFSDIPLKCPAVPRFYGMYNMEIPPKNMPLPLPQGNTDFIVGFHLTDTMETILEYRLFLYVKK